MPIPLGRDYVGPKRTHSRNPVVARPLPTLAALVEMFEGRVAELMRRDIRSSQGLGVPSVYRRQAQTVLVRQG